MFSKESFNINILITPFSGLSYLILKKKGKTVDVLRSSIMDEATTHDFIKILLEQPDSITLDVAVEVMTNTTLLAKSKHSSHIKIASAASKFVLTHFGQMIKANQDKTPFPTLNQEERSEKCDLIKKMGFQIRQNLKLNKFRIGNTSTLYNI